MLDNGQTYAILTSERQERKGFIGGQTFRNKHLSKHTAGPLPNERIKLMSQIIFNEETHTYEYNGKVMRSVTDIASEICNINKSFFSAESAAVGTDVHTELARLYDPKDSFSIDDSKFEKTASIALWLKPSPTFMTEVIVFNESRGYAGTIDLLSIVGNKVHEIVDFKTGSVNKKYCTVQLSLYKLALESMGYDCTETRCRVISPKGITKIEPLDWAGVWDLAPSELEPTDLVHELEQKLVELLPYYIEYKEVEEAFRIAVKEQLESAGTTKYSGSAFDVSYVGASTRTGLDTARLKAELPDVYQSYLKETSVSPTVKLTSKKEN